MLKPFWCKLLLINLLLGIFVLNGGAAQLIMNVSNQNGSSMNVSNQNASSIGFLNTSRLLSLDPQTVTVFVNDLIPNTLYSVTLGVVVLGGATITSQPVNVQTLVGSKKSVTGFILLRYISGVEPP